MAAKTTTPQAHAAISAAIAGHDSTRQALSELRTKLLEAEAEAERLETEAKTLADDTTAELARIAAAEKAALKELAEETAAGRRKLKGEIDRLKLALGDATAIGVGGLKAIERGRVRV